MLVGLVFAIPAYAQEAPRLDVTFIPDPLFSEDNFLPGDGASGQVLVLNNTDTEQTILTEAVNILDVDGLGDVLTLEITRVGTGLIYGAGDGSFADFLTGGELVLGTLAPGDTADFTFDVAFRESAGNEYQLAELGFDICVGFQGDNQGSYCGDTAIGGEQGTDGGTGGGGASSVTGGGGGGGLSTGVPLAISNEQVAETNPSAGTATITWQTNYLATSQVVYGPATAQYSLDIYAPNFGYPMGTVEDSAKVIDHEVILTGLTEGETYLYRVISRASPPTVSYERSFTFTVPPAPVESRSSDSGDTASNVDAGSSSQGSVRASSGATGGGGGGTGGAVTGTDWATENSDYVADAANAINGGLLDSNLIAIDSFPDLPPSGGGSGVVNSERGSNGSGESLAIAAGNSDSNLGQEASAGGIFSGGKVFYNFLLFLLFLLLIALIVYGARKVRRS